MNIFKKLLPYKFKRKIKEDLGVPSLHWSLENLKKRGFNPSVIIDIGAYQGNWTIDVLEVFPSARIVMVEAQKRLEKSLKEICMSNTNVEYFIKLLSSNDGDEKLFCINETASHVAKTSEEEYNYEKIKSQTLDTLLKENKIPFPAFLKLDVQGHELEVSRKRQRFGRRRSRR